MPPPFSTSQPVASFGLTAAQRVDDITVDQIHDVRRATAGALNEALRIAGRRNRSLIDLRGAGWPTPYAPERTAQLSRETPVSLCESTAVVVSACFAAHLVDLLIRKLTPQTQQTVRGFSDLESAIAGLYQRLTELGD